MKSSMIMTVAAVLFVAAFAGVVIADDEVNAAEGDAGSVVYQFGSSSFTDPIKVGVNDTTTLKNFAEVFPTADGTYFLGWGIVEGDKVTNTVVAGSSVTLKDDPLTITVKAMFTTYAVSFVDATFEDDETTEGVDESYGKDGAAIAVGTNGATSISGTPNEVITLPALPSTVTVPEGMQFVGWTIGGVLYAAGSEYTITSNAQAVATYNDGYTISFYVDETRTLQIPSLGLTEAYIPVKTGYTFSGWYTALENGTMVFNASGMIATGFVFTSDISLYAVFTPTVLTVTFVAGETSTSVPVYYGSTVSPIALPSGYSSWDFDFGTVITEDTTINAVAAPVDETLYVTFNIEGTIYGPYVVSDRFSVPNTDREGYDFLGWTIQGGDGTLLTSAQVQNYQYTEDVTFIANYVAVEPPAPEEPAFYETTTGQAAIVLVVFVIVLFVAAVYMNIGGLREKLFGWKITRKD